VKKYISIADVLILLAMLFFVLDLGYRIDRQDFAHLIFDYTALFLFYFYILYKTYKGEGDSEVRETFKVFRTCTPIQFWLLGAVILRGCLLFSTPNLSEDIYRFIWDGCLIHLGINPFDCKPSYYFDNQLFTDTLTPELYTKLNSENYFSVYPPVCQGVFAFAVWLFPKSVFGAMVVIKSFLFACEIGSIFLLYKMLSVPPLQTVTRVNSILIYALNPLIIIELCGNAHFEAAMIFFFLLAIYLLKSATERCSVVAHTNQRNTVPLHFLCSAFAFALSVASKMLPLMLLPLMVRYLGWKKSIAYGSLVGIFLVLLFLPLYNDLFINNIRTSLNLYFQKFEFNASIYYVYSHIEMAKWGFNPIITISRNLNIAVVISILLLTFLEKKGKNTPDTSGQVKGVTRKGILGYSLSDKPISVEIFFEKALFILSVYFLCAAIVHPWYASFLLVLSVFTSFRYLVVWTFLLPLTYIHYAYAKPTENFWVIGIEYLTVFGFFVIEKYIKTVSNTEGVE
jgi:alpha-1,6-mannosyltransferase